MTQRFESLMLATMLGPLVAVLQLFALYVVIHGHYSPGGGFQAGVLLACSMILPLLVHGSQARRRGFMVINQNQAVALASLGVLIYTAIGVASLFSGAQMLDYDQLPALDAMPPADRHSLGILLIELGVMLGVAGAVVAIFLALQGRSRTPRDQNGEAAI